MSSSATVGKYQPFARSPFSKERYKIEAKNSELKNVLGYDVSMGNCLYATKIQGACTIFAANIKRIITILDEK